MGTSVEEVEKELKKEDINLLSFVGLQKPIKKHSPEHQRHICRFLKIPVWEYDQWLSGLNYGRWRRINHYATVLAENFKKSLNI